MALARFFDSRFKLWAHLLQLLLIIIAIALTGAHMNIPGAIYSRAEIMTIAMGAKSIIVLGYQILSQHVARFRSWESPLANMILNILEVMFWLVVAVLKIQAMQRFCQGTACSLSAVVVVIAFLLFFLCVHVAIVSVLDYRYFKKNKVTRGHAAAPSSYAFESARK